MVTARGSTFANESSAWGRIAAASNPREDEHRVFQHLNRLQSSHPSDPKLLTARGNCCVSAARSWGFTSREWNLRSSTSSKTCIRPTHEAWRDRKTEIALRMYEMDPSLADADRGSRVEAARNLLREEDRNCANRVIAGTIASEFNRLKKAGKLGGGATLDLGL